MIDDAEIQYLEVVEGLDYLAARYVPQIPVTASAESPIIARI
jgi:hypothetical protein